MADSHISDIDDVEIEFNATVFNNVLAQQVSKLVGQQQESSPIELDVDEETLQSQRMEATRDYVLQLPKTTDARPSEEVIQELRKSLDSPRSRAVRKVAYLSRKSKMTNWNKQ